MPIFASGVTKGKEPSWVRMVAFDPNASVPEKKMQEGFYFLLAEKQSNIVNNESYNRYVRKIVNDAGVQSCTSISFDYNKSFEQITIHGINIIREGKVMDRLDLSKFKVMEQQNELVHNLYNDQITSTLLLEDVRVGDIIDVSYTQSGSNPILENKYYEYFNLGYSTPVAKIYSSLVAPDSRKLNFKYYNKAPEPKVTHQNGSVVYTWDITEVPWLKMDDGVPLGYDPYPGVSVSEYDNWGQVKRWAQQIYRPVLSASSPQALKLAKEIQSQYSNDEERLVAAVRYVQDKIRYFGVETGVNTHKPNNADMTLKLGYGDCKDKSVLLCSILRAMNIGAHPILIQTYNPGGLKDHLPSAAIFDHVCVQAVVHDSIYYFDATGVSQKADLQHYHFPNFKYGLVVTDSSTGLTPIPYSDNGAKTIIHSRILADDSAKPARLIVTTTYFGMNADRFRDQWNTQSHQEIEKSYLNFYAREYNGIESVADLKITNEDSVVNMLQTEEVYTIGNFWVRDKPGELRREFFAYNLLGLLNNPKDKKRVMPIGIDFPEHYVEEYEVVLPFDFTVQRDPQNISNDAFVFTGSYTFTPDDKTLHLRYTYDTKADRISEEQADKYFADVDLVGKMIDYTILWHPYFKEEGTGFSYFIFSIFLIVLAGAIWAAYRVYVSYDPVALYPADEGRSIGGWLILPAISVTILPFYFLYYFFTSHYFEESHIDMLFNKSAANYNLAAGQAILLDMALKEILAVWSVLMMILFYRRRSSLPRVFILYFAFNILTQIFMIVCEHFITLADINRGYVLFRSVIYMVVWGAYMVQSRRVKETFVNRYEPAPSPTNTDDGNNRFIPSAPISDAGVTDVPE